MAADERIETVEQALKGVFTDPEWLKKSAIGAAINMIPYVGAVWVIGFGLHYQRTLAWGTDARLPEWKNAQAQLKTGFYAFLAGIVYSLPLSVVLSAVLVVAIASGMLVTAASDQVGWVIAAVLIAMAVFMVLAVLYSIVLWPVYTHIQLYDSLSAGFEFGRIFGTAKEHSRAFWTTARRAVLLNLVSMAIGLLIGGASAGAAIAITRGGVPSDAAPLVSMLLTPVQLLLAGITGIVTVPITFAVNRLWAGYVRVAYGIGPQQVETSAETAS